MDLRDYLLGQVLNSLISGVEGKGLTSKKCEQLVSKAFDVVDQVMAERDKRSKEEMARIRNLGRSFAAAQDEDT